MLTATGVDTAAAKPLVATTEQVGPTIRGRGSCREGAAEPIRTGGLGSRLLAAGWCLGRQQPAPSAALAPRTPTERPPRCRAPSVVSPPQAVTTAKPLVEQAVTFLTTTEPALLGQYAIGLIAAYYLVRRSVF